MNIEKFEDIEAWQMGRELTKKVYDHSSMGQFARDWTLKDQMIRASSSIMHNIAEGFDSGSNPEFIRFLGYSYRSCSEVQSQLYVAIDQKYISDSEFNELYDHSGAIRAKIGAFIKYLRSSTRPNSRTA